MAKVTEAPISVGKAYAVAASYYLQSAYRSKQAGDHEQAAYTYELANKVRDYARNELGREDI